MRRRNSPQPTSIRLPPLLRKRLEKRADLQGWFLSVYIVRILEDEMNRLDRGERPLPTFQQQEP